MCALQFYIIIYLFSFDELSIEHNGMHTVPAAAVAVAEATAAAKLFSNSSRIDRLSSEWFEFPLIRLLKCVACDDVCRTLAAHRTHQSTLISFSLFCCFVCLKIHTTNNNKKTLIFVSRILCTGSHDRSAENANVT